MDTTARRRTPVRAALATALVTAGATALALLAPPATADSPVGEPTVTAVDEPTGDTCWLDVDTMVMRCWEGTVDIVAAIEEATGQPVVAVPNDELDPEPSATEPGAADGPGLAGPPSGPASTAVVELMMTVYDDIDYGGPSLSYSTSDSRICGIEHQFPTLGTWDNRIESVRGYNGCRILLYQNTSFNGLIYGPVGTSSNVGSARNQASSLAIG